MYKVEFKSAVGGWKEKSSFKNLEEAKKEMKSLKNPQDYRLIKLIARYEYQYKEVD